MFNVGDLCVLECDCEYNCRYKGSIVKIVHIVNSVVDWCTATLPDNTNIACSFKFLIKVYTS